MRKELSGSFRQVSQVANTRAGKAGEEHEDHAVGVLHVDDLAESVRSCLLGILLLVLVAVQTPPVRERASRGGVNGRDGLSPRTGVTLNLLVELPGFPDGTLDERAKRV